MSEPTLGVLILHGFTGSRATIEPVVPCAKELGVPWRLPKLRGHWTKPEDLIGVTYTDMLADAHAALDELRAITSRVVLVGLSVGGLISLNLTLERPADIDSLVVLAPALRYSNPLAPYARFLAPLIKTWKGNPSTGFADKSLVGRAGNYDSFPSATFVTIHDASRRIEARLPQITTPLLVLGARQDATIQPRSSQIVFDRVGSMSKELVWFERSGHEMLLDCEASAVVDRIEAFLRQRVATERLRH